MKEFDKKNPQGKPVNAPLGGQHQQTQNPKHQPTGSDIRSKTPTGGTGTIPGGRSDLGSNKPWDPKSRAR